MNRLLKAILRPPYFKMPTASVFQRVDGQRDENSRVLLASPAGAAFRQAAV
jgi:hypothetical protein